MKRRISWCVVPLAALLSWAPACASSNGDHTCTLIGCLDGVTIAFSGSPPPGHTYHVVISTDTATENVPLLDCNMELPDGGVSLLRCNSGVQHSEPGNSVVLADTSLPNVRVTVTDGSTSVLDQSYPLSYKSSEINGPGCGVCTTAQVSAALP